MTAHDFSTPEGAILMLEDAYRARDIEAAVSCKDFRREAALMLSRFEGKFPVDEDLQRQTAQVLELAFRKEMETKGFPELTGVTCTFPRTETRGDGLVVVTKQSRRADGTVVEERILVGQTPDGWRALVPVDAVDSKSHPAPEPRPQGWGARFRSFFKRRR
jgi:hypothetical protein